jgi:hypothetical protein
MVINGFNRVVGHLPVYFVPFRYCSYTTGLNTY